MDHLSEHLHTLKATVRQVVWSLALQGLLFVVLAVLIVLYPALLVALAAVTFGLIGICLLTMAVRLHQLWNQLPGFIRNVK